MQYVELLQKVATLLAGKAPVILKLLKALAALVAPSYTQLLTDVEELLAAGDPQTVIAELKQIWADIQALHDATPEVAAMQATFKAVAAQTTSTVVA